MLKLHEFIENINKTQYRGKILQHEGVAGRTTMKTGGTAALFLAPADKESVFIAVYLLENLKIPYFVLGGGSNVIFPDGELEAAVVSTEELNFIKILKPEEIEELNVKIQHSGTEPVSGNNSSAENKSGNAARNAENSGCTFIECGAGTKTGDLVDFCTKNAVSGLETFAGLPGTAGGAAFMNARCYGKEISEVLAYAEFFEFAEESAEKFAENGSVLKNFDFNHNFIERCFKMYHNKGSGEDWAYKNSPFMHNHRLVTSLIFKAGKIDYDYTDCNYGCNKEEPAAATEEAAKTAEAAKAAKTARIAEISSSCNKYIEDREKKGHFRAPSAGSVFKNDRRFGEPSGVLIDKAGLKGTECGGAQVAPWHGNIIINRGNASSSDIKNLVSSIQDKVREKTGFTLEPEIIFAEENLK